jgi:hypothetical protein
MSAARGDKAELLGRKNRAAFGNLACASKFSTATVAG